MQLTKNKIAEHVFVLSLIPLLQIAILFFNSMATSGSVLEFEKFPGKSWEVLGFVNFYEKSWKSTGILHYLLN